MIKLKILFSVLIIIIAFEASLLLINKNNHLQITPLVCSKLDATSKLKCFEDLMDQTLKNSGLDKTFELMDNLFNIDPDFAANCHGFAHLLGEKAYLLFSQDKDFILSTKTSYCGYGFYHGFMEKLFQSKGTIDQAQDFCKWAGQKLKDTTSDAEGACYHGIGHGAVEDVTDPKLFGSTQAIIKPSLELCEKVSADQNPPPQYGKLFRCVSGVFNALEIVSSANRYKLSINKDDPFWICKLQPDRYKEACYSQFVVIIMNITANNHIQSAQIIDSIEEDAYALPTLEALVVERVRLQDTNYQQTINYCRSLPKRFNITCIQAFGSGFLKYGPPQTEYIKALDFCSSGLLTDTEKTYCYNRVLSLLRQYYSAEKSQTICQSVQTKYQQGLCQYN